ncbi:hypothetical protein HZA75_00135, partial [Candidatus Roizmanbacteria bacterium]|nr:hypothetical protein [Candidatus Roizmanbacteria bacterium]
MFKKILNYWQLLFLIVIILFFFKPFIFQGKIPISADTIVGMYHPYRDKIWDNFTQGVPFKNFLITDAVRQQYPWRLLSINLLKNGQSPLWNNFNFSGTALLANPQSGVFYPLNFLYWVLAFNYAWGVQIFLQVLLAGLFFYLWLRVYNISKTACLLGGLSFIFSGFFVAWLEWNTILQAALWLPLILLAKEKIIRLIHLKVKNFEGLFNKDIFFWSLVLIFSETSSFLAGHLQTFFYVLLISSLYLAVRFWQLNQFKGNIRWQLTLFATTGTIVFLLSSPQLLPSLEFIFNSARSFDQPLGFRTDWYLPWQHLIQFIAPDFFGNPATLNYWGQWNYGEFVGYIGIIPLLLATIAILGRRDKKTLFFGLLGLLSLIFALP